MPLTWTSDQSVNNHTPGISAARLDDYNANAEIVPIFVLSSFSMGFNKSTQRPINFGNVLQLTKP